MDDGMFARFAEDRYVAYVSTAHAAPSIATCSIAVRRCGRNSTSTSRRSPMDGLSSQSPDRDRPRSFRRSWITPVSITKATFPPMTAAEIAVCGGVPARLCALSYSGERSFELAVPAGYRRRADRTRDGGRRALRDRRLWQRGDGRDADREGPSGGGEINGQTTAYDLGMQRALAKDKDHVGRVLSGRPALVDPARPRSSASSRVDPAERIRAGAHIVPRDAVPSAETDLGWVSSACYSPTLSSWIGLAMVSGGPDRIGEEMRVYDPLRGDDVAPKSFRPASLIPKVSAPVSEQRITPRKSQNRARTGADAALFSGRPPRRAGRAAWRKAGADRGGGPLQHRGAPRQGGRTPGGDQSGIRRRANRRPADGRGGRIRLCRNRTFALACDLARARPRGAARGASAAARGLATVVDVSHGFVAFRLSGLQARRR